MTVVVTAAGRSLRYGDAGVLRPKWALDLGGRTMLARAVDSVATFLDAGHDLRIVVTADQLDELERCAHELPLFVPVVVDRPTPPGQALDAVAAYRAGDADDPFVIWNADTFIHTPDLAARVVASAGSDAWLLLADKPGDHWSFAELDGEGCVVRCAEKDRISAFASAGLYGFSTGNQFIDAVEYFRPAVTGEMYVAPLYNRVIATGAAVHGVIVDSDDIESVGTPEELRTACALRQWPVPGELR